MAAAEHQRTRAVESGSERGSAREHGRERQRQQGESETSKNNRRSPGYRRLDCGDCDISAPPADDKSGEGAEKYDGDLAPRRRNERRQDQRQDGDRRPRPVGREALGHPQDRLGDDCNRDQLEAVEQPIASRAFQRALAVGEERHRDAEGSVNAAQAARPPRYPARMRPIAKPVWLLAGPGRNWQSATRSA